MFARDFSRDRRGQRLRGLPTDSAAENDVYQCFVISEQGYVDSAADRDEAGHPTKNRGNGAADAVLEIEMLAADAPQREDQATADED
jgi:hypothetical protein